jgi:hypothetical protein
MYCFVPWQFALTLLWQYEVDPASFTLDVWRDAQRIVSVAAQNSDRFANIVGYAADLHCFAAEISLTMCEKLEPQDWPPEIHDAAASISWGTAITHLQKPSLPSTSVSLHLMGLMQHYLEYWQARMVYEQSGQTALFTELSEQIPLFIRDAQHAKFGHLVARGYLLLGRTYEYLEDVPTTALAYFRLALALFEQETEPHVPRIAETLRAIDDLLAEFPEL